MGGGGAPLRRSGAAPRPSRQDSKQGAPAPLFPIISALQPHLKRFSVSQHYYFPECVSELGKLVWRNLPGFMVIWSYGLCLNEH